jgi:hypothetical protein
MAKRRSADITNNAGGVMTDEVGVITGDLTLVTELTSAPSASATNPSATSGPPATQAADAVRAATSTAAVPAGQAAAVSPVTGRLTPTTTPFLHPGAPAGTAPMSAAAASQPSAVAGSGAGGASAGAGTGGAGGGAGTGGRGANGGAAVPATAVLRVQYKGADEWYTVTNGTCQLPDAAALDVVHQLAVGLLNRPEG